MQQCSKTHSEYPKRDSQDTQSSTQERVNRWGRHKQFRPSSTPSPAAAPLEMRLLLGPNSYSLVTINTPRFGKLGVYVLEGVSALILLTVREMRRRGMVIDCSNSRALITSDGELVELDVSTNSRGHLLIDLSAP